MGSRRTERPPLPGLPDAGGDHGAGGLLGLAKAAGASQVRVSDTTTTHGYNSPVSESALKAFVARPVPTVRAEELRRVWSFLASDQSRIQAQRSVSLSVVAGLCGPKTDALAVWFRATLIQALLRRGRLDRWRDGSSLQDKVFEVAARFPLPKGPAEADLDALVAAME